MNGSRMEVSNIAFDARQYSSYMLVCILQKDVWLGVAVHVKEQESWRSKPNIYDNNL